LAADVKNREIESLSKYYDIIVSLCDGLLSINISGDTQDFKGRIKAIIEEFKSLEPLLPVLSEHLAKIEAAVDGCQQEVIKKLVGLEKERNSKEKEMMSLDKDLKYIKELLNEYFKPEGSFDSSVKKETYYDLNEKVKECVELIGKEISMSLSNHITYGNDGKWSLEKSDAKEIAMSLRKDYNQRYLEIRSSLIKKDLNEKLMNICCFTDKIDIDFAPVESSISNDLESLNLGFVQKISLNFFNFSKHFSIKPESEVEKQVFKQVKEYLAENFSDLEKNVKEDIIKTIDSDRKNMFETIVKTVEGAHQELFERIEGKRKEIADKIAEMKKVKEEIEKYVKETKSLLHADDMLSLRKMIIDSKEKKNSRKILDNPINLIWEKNSSGDYCLKNENGKIFFSVKGEDYSDIMDGLNSHCTGRVVCEMPLNREEMTNLANIILLNKKLENIYIKNSLINISLDAVNDFPFEAIADESGVPLCFSNLIVRKTDSFCEPKSCSRLVKKQGCIKTCNPYPELFCHDFEKTAFNIIMKSIFHENAVFKDGKKEQALYIMENSNILHFAGHSGVSEKGEPLFQINGKNKIDLTGKDIEKLNSVPEFIWMNSCESANSGLNSWAEIFIKKGVICFIGCSNKMSDIVAEKAASIFYDYFSLGETAGYSYYMMMTELCCFPEIFLFRFYGDSFYSLNI
jgi:hypothetical protein